MEADNSGEGSGGVPVQQQEGPNFEVMLRQIWEQQNENARQVASQFQVLTGRLEGLESRGAPAVSTSLLSSGGGSAEHATPQSSGPQSQLEPQGQTSGPSGQSTGGNAAPTQTYSGRDEGRPKPTQPNPHRFSGEDTTEYPQFRGLLEAKLRIDAAAIGGMDELVWFAFGRLKGTAAGRIWAWMNWAKDTERFTLVNLFQEMDKSFDDPQKQNKALAELNAARQGGRDLRTFLSDFDRLILEARGWSWDDSVRKGFLKAALDKKYLRALIGSVESSEYREFCSDLQRIDNQLSEVANLDRRRPNQAPGSTNTAKDNPSSSGGGDSMEWQPTGDTFVSAAKTRRKTGPPAKWVSKEELERRKENQLCLRCGSSEHYLRSCKYGPAKKPDSSKGKGVQAAATKSKKKKAKETCCGGDSDSEDSGSGSDSEESKD